MFPTSTWERGSLVQIRWRVPAASFPPIPIYSKLPSSCKSDNCRGSGEVWTNKLCMWLPGLDKEIFVQQCSVQKSPCMGGWAHEPRKLTNQMWEYRELRPNWCWRVWLPQMKKCWEDNICSVYPWTVLVIYMKYMYLNVCKLNR